MKAVIKVGRYETLPIPIEFLDKRGIFRKTFPCLRGGLGL